MSEEAKRSEGVPINRETRLCDAMTEALEAHPEYRKGDKCCIFIDSTERAGLVMHGYEDDSEALTNVLVHVQQIFAAHGAKMEFHTIPQPPDPRAN